MQQASADASPPASCTCDRRAALAGRRGYPCAQRLVGEALGSGRTWLSSTRPHRRSLGPFSMHGGSTKTCSGVDHLAGVFECERWSWTRKWMRRSPRAFRGVPAKVPRWRVVLRRRCWSPRSSRASRCVWGERGRTCASRVRACARNCAGGWGCAFWLTSDRRRAIGNGMPEVTSVSYPPTGRT